MQVLYDADAAQREPILAVVGRLQFEVVQARLEAEYGVTTVLEALPYKLARWLEGPEEVLENLPGATGCCARATARSGWWRSSGRRSI